MRLPQSIKILIDAYLQEKQEQENKQLAEKGRKQAEREQIQKNVYANFVKEIKSVVRKELHEALILPKESDFIPLSHECVYGYNARLVIEDHNPIVITVNVKWPKLDVAWDREYKIVYYDLIGQQNGLFHISERISLNCVSTLAQAFVLAEQGYETKQRVQKECDTRNQEVKKKQRQKKFREKVERAVREEIARLVITFLER